MAKSKNNLPDAESLTLFCWAAESLEPLRVLAGSLLARVITAEEGQILAWAQNERRIKELLKQRKRLEPEG